MSDGKDSAGLTSLTFPAAWTPKNVGTIVPCKAQVKIDTAAYVSCIAQIVCNDATAGNRVLTCVTGTLTNTKACDLIIEADFEFATTA